MYIDRTAAFVALFCISYIQPEEAYRGKKNCILLAVHDLEYPRLEIDDPHILNDPIQARHKL